MTARMEIKYIECLLLIRVDSLFMVTVEREPGGISFLWRRPWKTVGTGFSHTAAGWFCGRGYTVYRG